MKPLFLIIAMTIGLSVAIMAQETNWIIQQDQVRSFLDRQDQLFEDYSVALGDAYYDYYSGVLEDAGELETLKADRYVQKDSMEAFRRRPGEDGKRAAGQTEHLG